MQKYTDAELKDLIDKLSVEERAYISGLFDGEGCIRLHLLRKQHVDKRLVITMTNKDVITWLANKTGLGSIHKKTPKQPTWRPIYYWTVTGRQAVALAEAIRPWSIVKSAQIDLFLDYVAQETSDGADYGVRLTPERVTRRREAAAQMSALKRVI